MMFNEKRTAIINFSHNFKSIEYINSTKAIDIKFNTIEEVNLFNDIITEYHANIFKIYIIDKTVILKPNEGVDINDVCVNTIPIDNQIHLSISLSYKRFKVGLL